MAISSHEGQLQNDSLPPGSNSRRDESIQYDKPRERADSTNSTRASRNTSSTVNTSSNADIDEEIRDLAQYLGGLRRDIRATTNPWTLKAAFTISKDAEGGLARLRADRERNGQSREGVEEGERISRQGGQAIMSWLGRIAHARMVELGIDDGEGSNEVKIKKEEE